MISRSFNKILYYYLWTRGEEALFESLDIYARYPLHNSRPNYSKMLELSCFKYHQKDEIKAGKYKIKKSLRTDGSL